MFYLVYDHFIALKNSWAKVFADEIFPAIDEKRFSVLYSDKASGPNTPDILLALYGSGYHDPTGYELSVRCLSEQTVVENETRRPRTKNDGGMGSSMLQNPSDPEATFRSKAGKDHRGYVANLEESVGENGSVVTEYQYEQITHSDSQFIQEHLEQMARQEEGTVITK